MAKSKPVKEQTELFPDTQQIIALLSRESEQDLVILAVPSHDRSNKALADALVGEWTHNAMKLMADLYKGATAHVAMKGIYKTDEGHYLWDSPNIIESFATIKAIHEPQNLNLLVHFCKRMGKTLNQDCIMLVFGTVMYYLSDYNGV